MEKVVFQVPGTITLTTDKIGLIDADFLKYLVIHDINKDIKNQNAHIHKDPVLVYTKERVNSILTKFDCKGLIFCFSGVSDETFRNCIAWDRKYKGNRSYEPLYEGQEADKLAVIKYVKDRFPTLLFRNLEADDVLSMLQDDETFIFSKDKDLLQIPGTHYDIKREKFIERTGAECFEFLMKQMIEGDTVDNITGLKGCGPAKSSALLTNHNTKTLHQVVLNEYVVRNGLFNGIDMFAEAWNLLRMRNNRGDHFISQYKGAFDLLRMIKKN